jgi:hypothetical protein
MGTQPNASRKSSCEARRKTAQKAKRRLERRAGVGIDFAVQADFFKSGCGPFHGFPQSWFRRFAGVVILRIIDSPIEINLIKILLLESRKNNSYQATPPQAAEKLEHSPVL